MDQALAMFPWLETDKWKSAKLQANPDGALQVKALM
jgi:hypothetical protein